MKQENDGLTPDEFFKFLTTGKTTKKDVIEETQKLVEEKKPLRDKIISQDEITNLKINLSLLSGSQEKFDKFLQLI